MRNVADNGGESGFTLEALVSFSTYAVSLFFFPVAAMSLPAVPSPVFVWLAGSGVKATPVTGKTEGFSGADLRGVMARLRQMAFDRRSQLYTYGLADEVLSASSPTTSAETVRRIREWEATSGVNSRNVVGDVE